MKKIFLLFITFIFVVLSSYNAYSNVTVEAQGSILMELETGRVLFEKNSQTKMSMASTTKIMTAIMALESNMLDEIVETSKRAAAAPDVQMNLQVGEQHYLKDLLYPLMLESKNDVAIAIAEHISLEVELFCEAMTKKAHELGAVNTSFKTPNGLDAEGHFSTAYDMAIITAYALKNEDFVNLINTKSKTMTSLNTNTTYTFNNLNRLLTEYEGGLGVKTGFTNNAGQCFVGAAKRDGMTLISVVLNCGYGTHGKSQKWIDTKTLLNYGFENFSLHKVINENDVLIDKKIPVVRSREPFVSLAFTKDITVAKKNDEELKIKYFLPETILAPIKSDEKIGYAEIYGYDGVIDTVEIKTLNNAYRHDFYTSLKKIVNCWFGHFNVQKEFYYDY